MTDFTVSEQLRAEQMRRNAERDAALARTPAQTAPHQGAGGLLAALFGQMAYGGPVVRY